jgi:hypothetical protein
MFREDECRSLPPRSILAGGKIHERHFCRLREVAKYFKEEEEDGGSARKRVYDLIIISKKIRSGRGQMGMNAGPAFDMRARAQPTP